MNADQTNEKKLIPEIIIKTIGYIKASYSFNLEF